MHTAVLCVHSMAVPTHCPLSQASFCEHTSPSSHGEPAAVFSNSHTPVTVSHIA